jgi:hypothetical protein
MAIVYAKVAGFAGTVAGVQFTNGQATVTDAWKLVWFSEHGYGIGEQPTADTPDGVPYDQVIFPTAQVSAHIVNLANGVAASGSGAAAATLATGVEGDNTALTWTARDAGYAGNGISVALVDPGADGGTLAVAVAGNDITVTLATDDGDAATAEIGAGENGTVVITADAAGSDGNDLSVAVVVAGGNDAALSAAIVGDAITVTLGTDANGDPAAAKNTATLVAAAVHALAGVTAAASGTGADSLTAAEGPTQFTGGGANYALISTAADVDAAIAANAAANSLVTVANTGASTGAGVVSALVATNLAGGVDPKAVTGAEFNALVTAHNANVTKLNALLAACEKAGFVLDA